ncbi:hypothetical protein D3C73_984200 [compost metagenome]
MVHDQIHRQGVGRLPAQRHARRSHVVVVQLRATGQVAYIAIALALAYGQAQAQLILHQRRVVDGRGAVQAMVAELSFQLPFHVGRIGLARVHSDGADLRAAAIQRALRPLRHFHPLDVEQFLQHAARAAGVHIIEEEGNAWLGHRTGVAGLDATHHEAGRTVGLLLHEETGNAGRQPLEVGEVLLLDLLAGHCRDRDRHILDRLLALLRGHGHCIELGRRGRGIGCLCRRLFSTRQSKRDCQGQAEAAGLERMKRHGWIPWVVGSGRDPRRAQ